MPSDSTPVNRENWLLPQNLRWALRHSRQVVPHAVISRGDVPAVPFPRGQAMDLDDVTFVDIPPNPSRLIDFLNRSRVDAFLVLHRGQIVYERFLERMTAHLAHQWASMTKSITGLLTSILAERGNIDTRQPLAMYVPELAESPFGIATLQQNLDMTVAVEWPADITELHWMMSVGLLPNAGGVPATIRSFLPRIGIASARPHGEAFRYINSPSESVAWALCNVSGIGWPELVSREIWSKIGADQDATVIVDSEGTPQASGGLSSTAYDLARFAEMIRCRGAVSSRLSISRRALDRWLMPHADGIAAAERFSRGNIATGRPGFSYRNGLFHVNDGDGSIQLSGRFGQRVHINPAAELTVIQFASYAGPGEETANGFLAAMKAITARVRDGRSGI